MTPCRNRNGCRNCDAAVLGPLDGHDGYASGQSQSTLSEERHLFGYSVGVYIRLRDCGGEMVPIPRTSVRQTPSPRLRSMLFSLVALAALLIGVFVMHAGSPSASAAPMTASAHSTHDDTPASASVAVDQAHTSWTDCGEGCALDCAFMAMMCVLLLTLASMLLLATSPATFRRLLESGRRSLTFLADTAIPALRPNLVVLSISRT